MTGYSTILKIRRLEEDVAKLGMRMGNAKGGYYSSEHNDVLSLFPLDNELPTFSRDAELFTGTLEQLEVWLRGVEFARRYDLLLRVSDDKKRARKEQDLKNKQLLESIKAAGKTNEQRIV